MSIGRRCHLTRGDNFGKNFRAGQFLGDLRLHQRQIFGREMSHLSESRAAPHIDSVVRLLHRERGGFYGRCTARRRLGRHELRRILRTTLARRKDSDSKHCCKEIGDMFHGIGLISQTIRCRYSGTENRRACSMMEEALR